MLPGVPPGFPIRNTTLRLSDASLIGTIEHLLSALAGLFVWNATIDVSGAEIPILDGSAYEWAMPIFTSTARDLIQNPIEPITLDREFTVQDSRGGGAKITARPRKELGCRYTYNLDYGPNSRLKRQQATWEGDEDEYLKEISPARTFSLEDEVIAAKQAGLFKAFKPGDLPVVKSDGSLVEDEWRFENEPARHKLLDLIGDLALLGAPLQADVLAERSGHALTHKLCMEILAARKH